MARDSFVFYLSFYDAICELPNDTQLKLYNAIMRYSFFGEESELDTVSRAIFKLIRPQINANNVKYENGCKGGQYGYLGAEYGKRGGRPRKKKGEEQGQENAPKNPPKTPEKPAKNPRNVNDNVNENDNVCVTARAREFCTKYGIAVDTPKDTHTENLDFDTLDKAYERSAKFLQKSPASKCLSFVIKNYASIIAGKYEDMGGGYSDYGYGGYKGVTDESADAFNAAFAITSPDDL